MHRRFFAIAAAAAVVLGTAACGSSGAAQRLTGGAAGSASDQLTASSTSTPASADTASAGSKSSTTARRSMATTGPVRTAPLTGAVFRGIDALPATGSVPADRTLHVGVSLAGRDPAGAAAAVKAISNPSSSSYQHFFSADEWDARFGPDPAVRESVVSWLQRGGLDVLQSSGSYVYASGRASQVQNLFGVHLRTFTVATRSFYANVDAPQVPAGVTAVLGLSDYKQAHTLHQVAAKGGAKGAAPTPQVFPVSASTSPQDLWSIYDMPDENKGDGQGLSVFGWSMDEKAIGSDLRQFELLNKLPAVPFSVKHFGQQPGSTGTPDPSPDAIIEWDLDTQASSGMAPYASSITAYDGYSPTDVDLLAPIAGWIENKNGSKQGSASYGECEEDPVFSAAGAPASAASGTEAAWNAVLQKGVALGRTLFVSSGDTGFGCNPAGASLNGATLGPVPYQSWPAVSPYVVAVGGTVVTTDDGTPPKRQVEYAWTHGGGGPSPFNDQPDYQANAGVPLPTRGVPDVAAQSGDLLSGYNIVTGGSQSSIGGTSLSAPLMQGIWARVNAASAKGAGFANPAFYAHPDVFFDVVLGANGPNPATPGWDYTTGLGVPDVAKLIQAVDDRTAPIKPAKKTAPLEGYAQPACKTGTAPLTDPQGDATGLVISSTPRPSVDDLDIRSATAAIEGGDLAVTMTVQQLSSTPPTGGTGDAFDVGFAVDGQSFWVEAYRSLAGSGTDFGQGSDSRGTSFGETLPAPVLDTGKSTVTVKVPLDVLNKHLTTGSTPVGAGSVLSGFSAVTWQTEVALNGGVDSGAGACSITL